VTGLTLTLQAPAEVPLDEAVVVVVRLRNEQATPVTTSSRLDLAEGDLSVWVRAPGGPAVRVEWPWPVDSGRRGVTLEPGQELVGSALLLGLTPIFPGPGEYAIEATHSPQPDVEVRSEPVVVRRLAPADEQGRARQRALEDPEVVQSICSLSVIGSAAEGLALLAASDASPVAQLLSRCVTTVTDELPVAIERAAGATDDVTVAAALASVLPPGLFPGDERLAAASGVVGDAGDPTVTALLTGSVVSGG
jgi:hypothetical protein